MNRTNQYRAFGLIGAMVIVTILIFVWQTHHDQQKASAIAEQQHGIDAAAEHVQFVSQYVNKNIARTANVPLIAVAVADEKKSMNHALSIVLINRFKGGHAEFVDSFFKPPLISDGLFDDVFNGSTALFTKLEITNSVDGLLLGRQGVQYSTNTALDGVIMANMTFEVVNLTVAGRFQSQEWTFTSAGTGFRPEEARMQAEQRIIKQISDKSDMSLNAINPNH